MSNGIDRLIAYRTMRAVEKHQESLEGPLVLPATRWQRWQAFVKRVGDRLLL